jgi:hypothetical protein
MYYIDFDYYFRDEKPYENNSWNSPMNSERLNLPSFDDDDDDDYDVDEEAYFAIEDQFSNFFTEKTLAIIMDIYPQFHEKKDLLKKKLLDRGKSKYALMSEVRNEFFYGSPSNGRFENNGIRLSEVNKFIHNSTFDSLLENYDAWFKQKMSFENIYVESFCAAVLAKRVYNLLMSLLYKYFPEMNCLSSEQLDELHDAIGMEAWDIYDILTAMDPDEFNDSTVMWNLEDYEFEPLLLSPGPQVIRDADGIISGIHYKRNGPNLAEISPLCIHCRNYNLEESPVLCAITRFGQRKESDFKCRAFEAKAVNSGLE